jgi:hypothetical protein
MMVFIVLVASSCADCRPFLHFSFFGFMFFSLTTFYLFALVGSFDCPFPRLPSGHDPVEDEGDCLGLPGSEGQ